MKFIFVLLFAFLSVTGFSSEGDCSNATSKSVDSIQSVSKNNSTVDNYRSIASVNPDKAPVYSQHCCKVCTVGKACGNSCISRSKTCHKVGGCACDG